MKRWRFRILAGLVALGVGMLAAPVVAQTAIPAIPSKPIQIGQSISGTITIPNGADRFALFGVYDDLVSIGMFAAEGTDFQPAFEVYAPDGSVIVSADGAAKKATEAVVSALKLPSTGLYIINTYSGKPFGVGAYTLAVGSGWNIRELEGERLQADKPARGTLTRTGDRQTWLFEATVGTRFRVIAQPSAASLVDPVIEVLYPDGKTAAVAHDFSAANSAATAPITVTQSGTWHILISAYVNASTGDYDLIVEMVR